MHYELRQYASTFLAASFPLAIARTTSEAPDAASPQTNTFSGYSGCSGLRNPIASNTNSALIISGFPFSTISGRPPSGLGFQSISCTFTPVSLPSSPRNSSVLMFHRRVHPSSWLDVVLNVRGKFGQGFFGSSDPTGGFGIISICVTLFAPCLCAVPMQSLPVSPPPMTSTSLLLCAHPS